MKCKCRRKRGGAVVADEVQFQHGGHGCVDGLEKAEELLVAMVVVLGDHRSAGDIQCGEQVGGAVADVAMGHPRRRCGQDRQARRGAIQRAGMWFFRRRITPTHPLTDPGTGDDVPDLVEELGIGGQLPRFDQLRLEPECR